MISLLTIAGQVSTLIKVLKNDRTPVLRNLVVLPLLVQQEQDTDLQVQNSILPRLNTDQPQHINLKPRPHCTMMTINDNDETLSALKHFNDKINSIVHVAAEKRTLTLPLC